MHGFQKLTTFFSKKIIKNFPLTHNFLMFPWEYFAVNRRKWPFQTSKIQNFPDPPRMCGSNRAGLVKFC